MTDPSTTCEAAQNFTSARAAGEWFTVLDGVMGGRSSGELSHTGEHMRFAGVLRTRDGGFASIRRRVLPGALDGADALRLRLRTDGRPYRIFMHTEQRFRGFEVSFQQPIPATPAGEWATVDVPLRDLDTTVRGEPVPVDSFDQASIREIGIILADGEDGPYELELAEIGCA